jgi:hypothetical protein
MTSLFNVIAHEDANDQTKLRQASALAFQRVEDRFSAFVRQGSVDDQAARFSLVEEDVRAVVAAACEQVGYHGGDEIYNLIAKNFVTADAAPQLRTAGVRHEARKPKMCPYHSEVTDISLAAGDPSAGFNAMAQHAWTSQHCQGGEYEGDRCKFKPQMTTQAYWDERAERAEQKRQERAEQAELQAEPTLEVQTLDPEDPATQEEFIETVTDAVGETEGGDLATEPSAIGEGVDETHDAIPMAMAASTKVADGEKVFHCSACGAQGTYQAEMGNPFRQVFAGPQCKRCGASGTRTMGPAPAKEASAKTADSDGLGGKGETSLKTDRRNWRPKLKEVDDPKGKHPTKRKDVIEPITQKPDEPDNKSKPTEIGEATTERQDVTKKWDGPNYSEQGGTHTEGVQPLTAVSGLLDKDQVGEALAKFKRN